MTRCCCSFLGVGVRHQGCLVQGEAPLEPLPLFSRFGRIGSVRSLGSKLLLQPAGKTQRARFPSSLGTGVLSHTTVRGRAGPGKSRSFTLGLPRGGGLGSLSESSQSLQAVLGPSLVLPKVPRASTPWPLQAVDLLPKLSLLITKLSWLWLAGGICKLMLGTSGVDVGSSCFACAMLLATTLGWPWADHGPAARCTGSLG